MLLLLLCNCVVNSAGDELENIIGGIRNEVKSAGIQDTRENCWSFFIDRVRRQLKVVLCFSPVGSTLRVRGRKFPAIVNCTAIDWFHEWPEEALISVSSRFLSEVELIPVSLYSSTYVRSIIIALIKTPYYSPWFSAKILTLVKYKTRQ